MSNENISVGDLVRIKYHRDCCVSDNVGTIFIVSRIENTRWYCGVCGKQHTCEFMAYGKSDGLPTAIKRLVKIPPLSELISTEIKEEIPA